jgi:DNA-binding NtrC family response regulator
MSEVSRVLAVCPRPEDRVRLHEILRGHRFRLDEAVTWRDGARCLALNRPHVVICEATLPDADWKEVLGETASLSDAPRVIVISKLADESLWAEVLNLGGYDVLPTPLIEDEVTRVVWLAWQNWNNERERQWRQSRALPEKENVKCAAQQFS